MPEGMEFHENLHTPRTYADGTLDHKQEALRLLELADEVAVRTAEGAMVYSTQAQVHATLYAADVEVASIHVLRYARLQSRDNIDAWAKDVLRL